MPSRFPAFAGPSDNLCVGAILALLALTGSPARAVDGYSGAHVRVLSAPDCVAAAQMVAEFAPAPVNTTYLRVQHIGDPGTTELLQEIAHPVSWDVGLVTGFFPPRGAYGAAQRGFRDVGPANAASAFQHWCNGAGFYLDTRQFSHAAPLVLEGPSVSVARDLAPGLSVFRNATSALTIDARVSVPVAAFDSPPRIDGTIQVSFYYYAQDMTTGTVFAHVIALFDNREPGVNSAGAEAVSADAYTAFVVSPLLANDFEGMPTKYLSVPPASEVMHFVAPWSGSRFFRAQVPYERFEAMLLRLRNGALPRISVRPEDYRVTSFGLLGEVFPGTGDRHEVALGASVTDLTLSEAYDDATGPTINYQGLWWNAPAGSESGWGINLAHQDDVIFATWFTYDPSGRPWWLTMTANRTEANAYSGTLYRTTGPAFNAVPFEPGLVTRVPMGIGTLTFTDVSNGIFVYTISSTSQTKVITRQVFGAMPICASRAGPELTLAANYQDLWWAAPPGAESGWGVNFTHQDDTIFATWFTYDFDGNPLWLSATAPGISPGVYGGTLYRTTGPPFNALPFDPGLVTRTPVGTLTLTFANGNAATYAYTVNGVTQTKTITRQLFAPPAGTVCR